MVACLLDGLVAAPNELRKEGRELHVRMDFRLVCERTNHGQDRALDGLLHRGVGLVRCPTEGLRNRCGVDLLGVGQRLGRSSHDLRQDHAGVPASTEQRRVSHLLGQTAPIGLCNRLLQGLGDGPNGQEHVRPRVSVGDREDVEVVQAGAVAIERSLSRTDELEDRVALAHQPLIQDGRTRKARTSSMVGIASDALGDSECFFDFPGLQAPGADVSALRAAVEQHADALEVRIEASLRRHHRVAPVVPEGRLLPADGADLGHRGGSLASAGVRPLGPEAEKRRRPSRGRFARRRRHGRSVPRPARGSRP